MHTSLLACHWPQARAQAERQAVNTVTQGSAADMIKQAMVRLHRILAQPHFQGAGRLVLQVILTHSAGFMPGCLLTAI